MPRFLLFILFGLIAVDAQAQTARPHSLTTSPFRNMIFLTQQVALDGQTALQAKVAPLTSSDVGFTGNKLASPLPSFPVPAPPGVALNNPTSKSDAMQASKLWMQTRMPTFTASLGSWMKSKGLSVATYNYTQDIMVSTAAGPKKQAIGFMANIDSDGRALYGEPKIIDPDPTTVQVIYTPLAVAEGLPQGWAYPNAGKLQWRILDKKMEPKTAWATIDVSGAYDVDQNSSNPDAKLRCLMDRRNGGCSGAVDVRQLINDTGSTYGLVEYVRTLQPVYENDAPVAAVAYYNREWNCSRYRTAGTWGMLLSQQDDVYFARQTADQITYQQLASVQSKTLSPTDWFDKSVPMSSLSGSNPDWYVINPSPNDNSLWYVGDKTLMRNVTYLAPTTQDLSSLTFTVNYGNYASGYGDGAGGHIINIDADLWTDGWWNWQPFGGQTSFYVPDMRQLASATLLYMNGWNTLQSLAVNGSVVWSADPRGGFLYRCNLDPNSLGAWGSPYGTFGYYFTEGGNFSPFLCTSAGAVYAGASAGEYWISENNDSGGSYRVAWDAPARTMYPQSTVGYGDTRNGVPWGRPGTLNRDIRPYIRQGWNTIDYTAFLTGFGRAGGGNMHIQIQLRNQCVY